MNLLHHPPQNSAVQGYLNAVHHSPFGVWTNVVWDPVPLLWNQQKDPISFRNRELEARLCRDPRCCSGNKFKLSFNNAPYRIQRWMYLWRNTTGFAQFCSVVKKKPTKTKSQKNPPANLRWLHLLLHLHHGPAKPSRYVDWLYFKARDAYQVLLTPYLSQGLDNCAPYSPVPKTGKLNYPSCCIYCAP